MEHHNGNANLSISLIIIGICYHHTGIDFISFILITKGSLLRTLLSSTGSWLFKANLFGGLLSNVICLAIDTFSNRQWAHSNMPFNRQIFAWGFFFKLCAHICAFSMMIFRMKEQYEVFGE